MKIFNGFFHHQIDLSSINQARIVLLPKTDTPLYVTDYRPISVINLVPKIISKVLANRIKPHLPQLVDEHQTAFIQGRLISENFIATREVLYHISRAQSLAVLLKLDFAKAYDTLEWKFLIQVLTARGFPQKLINWISHLLYTATSKIRINEQVSDPFQHRRGLRQGDPLSPYLFILAVDVLQRMTTNVSIASPYILSPKVPYPILNFQYADDTVMIASAKGQTLHLLMIAIHCFFAASGLMVNFQKSAFVPISIHQALLPMIERLLGCQQKLLPIVYLGLPLTLKTPNRMDYDKLLLRLEDRLQGWKAEFISRAGRLQLIKSVLLTIPIYFMTCFKVPKWLLHRIGKMARQFLWTATANGSKRPISLINWQTVCLPIECGGMGVANLHLQNLALLMRWMWRLYTQRRKLWGMYATMIYAVRHNPDGPLIISESGSFFWRSLISMKQLFLSSTKFRIESGKKISFWYDNWCGQPLIATMPAKVLLRGISLYEAKQKIQELLPNPPTRYQCQATQILSHLVPSQGLDNLMWSLTASAHFSVKSLYRILSQGGKERSDIALLWRAAVTPSMRLFFFLLLRNRLLTQEVMHRRNISQQQGCVMCDSSQIETALHLFFVCPYADRLWSVVLSISGYPSLKVSDSLSQIFLDSIPTNRDHRPKWITLFISTLWLLWRERNERIFRHHRSPVFVLSTRIQHHADLCFKQCVSKQRPQRYSNAIENS